MTSELAIGAQECSKVQTQKRFSICTLVTRREEYAEMLESFVQAGFDEESCEYLYLDNSIANEWDAFRAYNHFLNIAKGKYVIICHQDILLQYDKREMLESCIQSLDERDPMWAIAGNAGGVCLGVRAICITDPKGHYESKDLPQPVQSLDENFILMKASANLAVSGDLSGFHLYGTDLCQVARFLGYRAYVIPFNLYHKSQGHCDESFFQLREKMKHKYQWRMKDRFIQTTVTRFCLSSHPIKQKVFSFSLFMSIRKRIHQLTFKIKGAKPFHWQ
jgi:hypothetical protein